jgi:Ulp1 family protease
MPTSICTFKDSDLIINYHDAVIYGSDLKLLKNRTEWLNDSCIHFFFVLLQQHQREQEQEREREREQKEKEKKEGKEVSSSSFLFMDPSIVSYWMHQCTDQDDIEDFVDNTNFPKPKGRNGNGNGGGGVIFIAVNDDMALSSNGWQIPNSGSHWSLLLIIVGCGDDNNNNNNNDDDDDSEVSHSSIGILHFDSIRNSRNIRAAKDIAKKIMLHAYSDDNNRRKRNSDSNSHSDKPKVIQVKTPQQLNGYDCGVHVLGAAKILSSSTTASLMIYSNNDNNSDSMNSASLNSLEESLQQGVGNNSFDFCSKFRDEISSEILHLSSSSS